MKSIFALLFLSIPCLAFAQNQHDNRVSQPENWEFRAYACKNASLIAYANSRAEKAVGHEEAILQGQEFSVQHSKHLADLDEAFFSFSKSEIEDIGYLGFAIWLGLSLRSDSTLESDEIFNKGFMMCLDQLDISQ